MRRNPLFLGSTLLCLAVVACSDPTSGTPEPAGLVIDHEASQLEIGMRPRLAAYYVDAAGRRLGPAQAEWSVSDERIAIIDPDGRLTLAASYEACNWVEPGLCRLEVSARANGLQASRLFTVLPPLPVAKVSARSLNVEIGYTQHLVADVLLEQRSVPWCSIAYETRDPSVATVDGDGVVRGVNLGTTTVDVIVSGPYCPPSVAVDVVAREPFHVLRIEPDPPHVLGAGDTLRLTAIITNWKDVTYNATFAEWSSSDPAVLSVESGLLRAGTCPKSDGCVVIITARSGRLVTTREVTVR